MNIKNFNTLVKNLMKPLTIRVFKLGKIAAVFRLVIGGRLHSLW